MSRSSGPRLQKADAPFEYEVCINDGGDWAIEVRSPAETRDSSSNPSVSRPALGPTQHPVQWVPGVLSPGVKRGRGATLTTHLHLVPRS
jgi:hypothetical protein